VVSPNWSGYAVTGRPGSRLRYSMATGSWTEPTVTCGRKDEGTLSTIAVGLGGYGATAEGDEQVGTDANCGASGKPTYFAWFEVSPYPAYNIPNKVRPGDALTATVSILSSQHPPLIVVRVDDATLGWSATREVSWVSPGSFIVARGEPNSVGPTSPPASSAEWLVEAPASCRFFHCEEGSLANFSSVSMSNISAVANGSVGTLADRGWKVTRLVLVPGPVSVPNYPYSSPSAAGQSQTGTASSPAGATPGRASTDGRGFKVKWLAVAKGF
jgi:hypothetical protein